MSSLRTDHRFPAFGIQDGEALSRAATYACKVFQSRSDSTVHAITNLDLSLVHPVRAPPTSSATIVAADPVQHILKLKRRKDLRATSLSDSLDARPRLRISICTLSLQQLYATAASPTNNSSGINYEVRRGGDKTQCTPLPPLRRTTFRGPSPVHSILAHRLVSDCSLTVLSALAGTLAPSRIFDKLV